MNYKDNSSRSDNQIKKKSTKRNTATEIKQQNQEQLNLRILINTKNRLKLGRQTFNVPITTTQSGSFQQHLPSQPITEQINMYRSNGTDFRRKTILNLTLHINWFESLTCAVHRANSKYKHCDDTAISGLVWKNFNKQNAQKFNVYMTCFVQKTCLLVWHERI